MVREAGVVAWIDDEYWWQFPNRLGRASIPLVQSLTGLGTSSARHRRGRWPKYLCGEVGCGYSPRRPSVSRIGATDTLMMPSSGVLISSIRKIAPEVDNAHMTKAAMIVPLRGANRPNVPKIMDSHAIRTTSKDIGIEPFACSSASQRAAYTLSTIWRARATPLRRSSPSLPGTP